MGFFVQNARAGTRTRVQALATPGDNHYTTLACAPPTEPEFKRLSASLPAWPNGMTLNCCLVCGLVMGLLCDACD